MTQDYDVRRAWAPRLLGLLAGGVCVVAGLYLLGSQTADPDSYLETIAHGIGIYFIGKGLFVGGVLWAHGRQLDVWTERPPPPEPAWSPPRDSS